MSRFHALITNFIFGETSPRVGSRVAGDNLFGMNASDVYRSGCREVTNTIILPQGGAYKREGFRFARDTYQDFQGDASYYRTFELRDELEDLLLLLVPGEAWLYTFAFQVVGHVVTPYTQADLPDIGVSQYEQQVVIWSTNHRPRRLEFQDGVSLIDPGSEKFIAPFYSYDDERSPPSQAVTVTIEYTLAGPQPGYAVFSVSGSSAVDSHGGILQTALYAANDPATVLSIEEAMGSISTVVRDSAICTHVSTAGSTHTFSLEYKFTAGLGDGTGLLVLEETGQFPLSLVVTVEDPGVGGAEPLWSGPLLLLHGGVYWECIVAHTSTLANEPGVGVESATYWTSRGTVLPTDQDYDIATRAWAREKAFSPRDRGWPPAMGFHEQRLVGAGPKGARSVLAGAKISSAKNIFNFTLGVNDNDGLLYKLASAENAVIRWFKSTHKLFIGTSAGVFVQLAQPWTPTNVSFVRVNGYNTSQRVPAVEVDGDLFFPTIDDRQIRQVQWIDELQSWQSWELLCFAEHMFSDKYRIRQLVSYQGNETYLWAVRSDGALLCMTYFPSQGVYHALAWHKHAVSDKVIQVATGFDGTRFVTAALVNRVIYDEAQGVFVKHGMFEVMDQISRNLFDVVPTFVEDVVDLDLPLDWRRSVYVGTDWSVHLDSYEIISGTGAAALGVPLRFIGRVVQLVEDGQYLGQFIPDSVGRISVKTNLDSMIAIGFGYVARIEPNRLESQSAMTTQSQKIRWVKPVMRLITSAMPLLNGSRPNERSQDDAYDVATGLFTGDVYVVSFGSDGRLVIEQDLPLPMHLTGLFGLMTTEEG